jgi:hypothetical protein
LLGFDEENVRILLPGNTVQYFNPLLDLRVRRRVADSKMSIAFTENITRNDQNIVFYRFLDKCRRIPPDLTTSYLPDSP